MPRAPVAHPTSEDRRWRKHSRTGALLHGLRIRDMQTLLADRYGGPLPDDDAGRADAEIVLHHVANKVLDPRGKKRVMKGWLTTWAPWMPAEERQNLIARIIEKPRYLKADTAALKFNLTSADRTRLGITTIGAVDLLKEQRVARRRTRDLERKRRERRAAGAKPRAQYLATVKATSLSKAKPWQAAGVSRATWYRHQRETGSGDSISYKYTADAPCLTR